MRFIDLIEMELLDDRTAALRRAFAPYVTPLDVTGYEHQAVVVLINLSHKRADVKDLLDERLAATTLKDQKHLGECLEEVGWLHTHNLKYPDGRVAGQRIVAEARQEIPGYIGSWSLLKRLGWAHNSGVVNKARLFCTDFSWEGQIWNLAELLKAGDEQWAQPLRSLGVKPKSLRDWRDQLSFLLSQTSIPASVSRHSPQVRFPFQGKYMAVTPVVSHTMLCHIQRLRRAKKGRFTAINHTHSATVGSLPASLGGYVAVMNYPPPVWFSQSHTFSQSRSRRLETGRQLFDGGAIYNREFLRALRRLVELDRLPTLRERRSEQVASLRTVRRKLVDWLAPVVEWKEARQIGDEYDALAPEMLEECLVAAELSEWPRFHDDLNQQLHFHLQRGQMANRFAYHPALLIPLSGQLRAVLGALAKGLDQSETDQSGTVFLHLESLRVFDAQALANPYLVGIPSLTALWGLIHKYERKVRTLSGMDVRFTGVAWFLRSYSSSVGKRLPEPSVLKSRSRNVSRPGIIDTKLCDLVMDLVIRVSIPESNTLAEHVDSMLKAALPSAFAGGVLHPPSLYEKSDWMKLHISSGKLFRKLACLPRNGCWVFPAASKSTSLAAMLEKAESFPYLKPAMLGYGFLEEPCARSGSIEPLHVFAEPLVGLVHCQSPIEGRMRGSDYFYSNGFWSMESQEHAMLMKKA